MEDYTPTKACRKCNQELPATTEYFSRDKKAKDGLFYWCKSCHRAYYQENKDAIATYKREYRLINPEKIQKKNRQYYQANRDKLLEGKRENYQVNRDKAIEYQHEYYQANRDKILEQKHEYYQANQDELRDKSREYYQVNLDEKLEYQRKYRQVNLDKIREYEQVNTEKKRIRNSRRRARKRSLPDTFTVEQWQACLEYHHYCCAVCGSQLRDLFGNIEPHADHWIPLSYEGEDNPGTTADNIVCLCSACNLSKGAKLPDIWLTEQFGKRKAVQILERIQMYFEWTQSRK